MEDHAEAIAARLDAEQTVRKLLDATAGLNSGEHDVVVLCLMHEVSQDEAAVALGIRIGTVKSRLHRARAKLAAMIQPIKVIEQSGTSIVETRLS